MPEAQGQVQGAAPQEQPAPSASQQGGAPAAAATGGTPSPQPQSRWQQDPRWREKQPDDIYDAYRGLEGKLGSHAQLEQFAQQVNAFAQQYGGLERLAQLAQYGTQQWQEQQSRAQQPQQQNQAQNFERWDVMTPQEQAAAMYQQVIGQIQPYAEQIASQIRSTLQQENQAQLGGMQRQWDIFNRLVTKRLQNPNLPMEDVLQQMVSLAQSDPNKLMDLAINNLTLQQQIEQRANEIAQARIADYDQKAKNATLSSLTAVRPSPGPGLQSAGPRTPQDRKRNILQSLLAEGKIDPSQV